MTLLRDRLPALIAGLLLCAPVAGHEYWIEPGEWTPPAGEVLEVRHFVGHPHHAEEVPRVAARVARFVALGNDQVVKIVGREGHTPAGLTRLPSAGLFSIAYESEPKFLELSAERFRAYLFEESLGRIVTEREHRGEQESPGRELYSRCAQTIVRAGSSNASGFEVVPSGMTLEISPLADPTDLLASASGVFELTLELRHEGQPLPGARLRAAHLEELREACQAVTDERGRCTLRLPVSGAWVVTTVHMERAAPNEHDADWRSWWGSLTFAIPEPGGDRVADRSR